MIKPVITLLITVCLALIVSSCVATGKLKGNVLVITISADGRICLGKDVMGIKQLARKARFAGAQMNTRIMVETEEDGFQTALLARQTLIKAGFPHVTIKKKKLPRAIPRGGVRGKR